MDNLNDIANSLLQESNALADKLRSREARDILNRIGEVPEQSYLDIASLAAYICAAPIAAVSLIDDDTAYFKGLVGGNQLWSSDSFSSAPRELMVCNLTIKTPDQPCIIYDAETDSRVAGLPFVNGTYDYIRFHAGLPLTTKQGNAVGTICVFDRIPRRLRADQLDALERLRRVVLSLYGA